MTVRGKRIVKNEIARLHKLRADFSSIDLQISLNMQNAMSNLTFRRHLKRMGFHYLASRRKGIITEEDKKKRLKFAKAIKKKYKTQEEQLEFWRSAISMYTDIVGFEYKRNPYELATTSKARSWRKRGQGLEITRKGAKEGATTMKYLVGISYNRGIPLIKAIPHKLNGAMYAYIIREGTFENGVAHSDVRCIIQDNDPVQNSKRSKDAFAKKNIGLFRIPARSPDINIIENMFHTVKRAVNAEAKSRFLYKESEEEFCLRIENTLQNITKQTVNNLINSLPKRIDSLIAAKGMCLKY